MRTIPKSGTNYLRLLLTNYFYNIQEGHNSNKEFSNVDYFKMHGEIFPNIRSAVVNGKNKYKVAGLKIKGEGDTLYSDFLYDHGSWMEKPPFSKFFRPKKEILLYRNPLDILISRFYYFFKDRYGAEDEHSHPRELIDDYIPQYAQDFSVDETTREAESECYSSFL